MNIPHIAIYTYIIVKLGYTALISFASILGLACRGVQIICRNRKGLKAVLILVETLNLSNSPTALSPRTQIQEQDVSLQSER